MKMIQPWACIDFSTFFHPSHACFTLYVDIFYHDYHFFLFHLLYRFFNIANSYLYAIYMASDKNHFEK